MLSDTEHAFILACFSIFDPLFAAVPRRLQIIQGPDNITVAIAAVATMHCAVHGFPVPMVHWFKDGCRLTNCSTSFSLRNNGQLLTFRFDRRIFIVLLLLLIFFILDFNKDTRIVPCVQVIDSEKNTIPLFCFSLTCYESLIFQ